MIIGRFEVHPVYGAAPDAASCLGQVVFTRFFEPAARQQMIRARVSSAGYNASTCVREPAVITEDFLAWMESEVLEALDSADRGRVGALSSGGIIREGMGVPSTHF